MNALNSVAVGHAKAQFLRIAKFDKLRRRNMAFADSLSRDVANGSSFAEIQEFTVWAE